MNDFVPSLSWSEFVYRLADRLAEHKVEVPLFIVGGAVRDAYLRGKITDIDIDIAVDGDAVGLARKVADWLDADIYVMDRERGVARVLVNWRGERFRVDLARFRGENLEADLRDRDFTINAMAAELSGEPGRLIDPLNGADDLRQKVLRRCSPEAIKNDPIRAIRAVRLSTQLQLKIHPDTVADIRAQAGAIAECSAERVRDEFFKLLGLDRAARGLRVLWHLDLLRHILPRASAESGAEAKGSVLTEDLSNSLAVVERMSAILQAISSRRTDNTAAAFDMGMLVIQLDRYRESLQRHLGREYGGARHHAQLLILAALLHEVPEIDVSKLKLTTAETRAYLVLVRNFRRVTADGNWTILEQHRFWQRLKDCGVDAILLAAADFLAAQGNELEQGPWLNFVETVTTLLDAYFHRYDEIIDPALLLNGNDILEILKTKPGPQIGEFLTALREAQATGEVRTACQARELILQLGQA